MGAPEQTRESEIADLVRASDTDRFLTTAFLSQAERAHVLALYAFNIELAKVSEVTNEPMIGEIRLQWWREAVEEIYAGTVRQHHVVMGLSDTIAHAQLDQSILIEMIDARTFDVYTEPMESETALLTYCERTSGNLFYLAALAADPKVDRTAVRDLSLNAGRAYGLTNMLRAAAFHASRGRCYLPAGGGSAFDLSKYFELESHAGFERSMRERADQARAYLAKLRDDIHKISDSVFGVFLPCALVRRYLSLVSRSDDILQAPPRDLLLITKQWAYLSAFLRKTL